MSALASKVLQLRLGNPSRSANLTMIPLMSDHPKSVGYICLDEAISEKAVEVRELSEEGNVPKLLLKNRGDRPVLLLDGEELIGAKQNRVLNLSIMAPPRTEIVVPVSCVESGRWSMSTDTFMPASRALFARARASKLHQVSESLESRGERFSNQSQIWQDIYVKALRMNSPSQTQAMDEIFEKHGIPLDEMVKAFPPQPNQVGAVFAIDGRVAGLDCFETPEILSKLLPKLVRSYALDALDSPWPAEWDVDTDEAKTFLEELAGASSKKYEAVGMGEDVRIEGKTSAGAALLVDGCFVHICAFPRKESPDSATSNGRMSRASRKWRGTG